MCDTYPILNSYSDKAQEGTKEWTSFLESELTKDHKKNEISVSYIICQAKFQLKIEKDIDACIKLMKDASNHEESYEDSGTIINYLLVVGDEIDFCEKFLERIKGSITRKDYYNLKSDIFLHQSEYDKASRELSKSEDCGLSHEDYASQSSYLNLKGKKYQKTINIIDNNINKIKNPLTKDILTINRELAKKSLNKPVNEIELRNIISRQLSESLVIAAHCLLKNPCMQARRLIDIAIEKDYLNHFLFKNWPVIPNDYLLDPKMAKISDIEVSPQGIVHSSAS